MRGESNFAKLNFPFNLCVLKLYCKYILCIEREYTHREREREKENNHFRCDFKLSRYNKSIHHMQDAFFV